MVCEGLTNRINHDYHTHGIRATNNRFANMVPPLFSPNHPAIQDRLRERQDRIIGALERQGRYTPLSGYTPEERNTVSGKGAARLARDAGRLVAREEARRLGQREGYVLALHEFGAVRDGGDVRSRGSDGGSETGGTQNAFERFMHHKERKEHYGREVQGAHRKREREIEDQRRRMYSPPRARSTMGEVGGYREEVQYRRRMEDRRGGKSNGSGYEAERIYRPQGEHREPAVDGELGRYSERPPPSYERAERNRQRGRHGRRNEYAATERAAERAYLNARRQRDEALPLRRRNGFEDLRGSPTYRRQPSGSLYEGRDSYTPRSTPEFDAYPRAAPAPPRYSPSSFYGASSVDSSPPPSYRRRRYGGY